LSAAPQTVEIKKERDFIEATSRLCSFKIYSRPGIPVAPIEIRLSKDRLSFVSRLLASNEDSYRHPDVVLDLVAKLGYRGDKLAEIRSLAMIADSGLQAGDFGRAADVCDRMVEAVETLRKVHSRDTSPNAVVGDAADVAWQSCFQLGRHDDWSDLERRMRLLGQALVLCPGDKIPTLLPVWTKLEDQVVERRKNKVVEETTSFVPPSLGETAAAASRTFNRAAAFFGGSDRPRDSSPFPEENQERHAPQSATKAPHKEEGFSLGAAVSSRFGAGVGWLIGADEEREREERERGF
ncbi:Sec39-domain-containing protein, partial [Pseudohyphozyma bogoriensis]